MNAWQRFLRLVAGDALTGRSGRLLRLVIAVGLLSGLAAAAFLAVLQPATALIGPPRNPWLQALILTVVGGVIGLLIRTLGNPGDVELLVDNIHVSGGRADVRDLKALLPVSLLGIAAGSAIGPEAPLVQTTGSIGSWIALRLRLDALDLRLLTIAGMSAGFTVLLGAPVGGALFALEILHRGGLQYYEALIPALTGSAIGYAVFAAITGLGLSPYLLLPAPGRLSPADLGVGLLCGVIGAGVAIAFTYLVETLRSFMRQFPITIRPAVGGAALGLIGVVTPFALTFGEEQINEVATAGLAVGVLLLAAVGKLVGSAVITTAGWRGGFIIPLFFVGACLGIVLSRLLGTDQTVTMGALMAAAVVGVTKTLLGSTLVIAEIAGLRLLPSTLIASLVAMLLTSRHHLIETQRHREGEYTQAASDTDEANAEAAITLGSDDPALGAPTAAVAPPPAAAADDDWDER